MYRKVLIIEGTRNLGPNERMDPTRHFLVSYENLVKSARPYVSDVIVLLAMPGEERGRADALRNYEHPLIVLEGLWPASIKEVEAAVRAREFADAIDANPNYRHLNLPILFWWEYIMGGIPMKGGRVLFNWTVSVFPLIGILLGVLSLTENPREGLWCLGISLLLVPVGIWHVRRVRANPDRYGMQAYLILRKREEERRLKK